MKYRRMENSGLKLIDRTIDADIYGNGKSEQIIGEFITEETFSRKDRVIRSIDLIEILKFV